MSKYATTLKAATIAELLVVLIISSIVLLVVFDSLGTFSSYCSKISKHIATNSQTLLASATLDELFWLSDSVVQREDRLLLYTYGTIWCEMIYRDSCILLAKDEKYDTLLVDVVSLGKNNNLIELRLINNEKATRLVFKIGIIGDITSEGE